MKRLRRILLIFVLVTLIVVAVVIIFISPITKYMIQKYDVKYTGREITLDWCYVNPFTGYVYFKNLKIYENKSDSVFIGTNSLSVDFALRKFLFNHIIQINSAKLDHPVIKVSRDKKVLNFDDIIDKFSSGDDSTKPKKPSEPKHVNIGECKITGAEIHYYDKNIPVDYFIKDADFSTPGKQWDQDTMVFKYAFSSGPSKGKMQGQFDANFKTSDYLLADKITGFDLKPLQQYVRDLSNYGTFRATLDADLRAKGNFHNAQYLFASGNVIISDAHLGKTEKEDYASFQRLKLDVRELSPFNNRYSFDSISLIHPYAKYERYDNSSNLDKMFGSKAVSAANTSKHPEKLNILLLIGNYIKDLSMNFFNSDFKIDNLAILNADLNYNDFSLSEEFSTGVHGMDITANNINKARERVNVVLKSLLKPYGNVNIKLSIDPNDSSYFNLDYHINNVPITMFNAYTVTSTSFPLDRGTIEVNGAWNVLGGKIDSKNHLIITDPRTTKRVRGKDKKWIPVPLIFAFIRERGDVIDYEIPITGDLKNPKFHFHDVIMDLLKNIFVKPATTAYRFEVKNVEKTIEKSQMIKWPLRSSKLTNNQEKFLGSIADFLAQHREASIKVDPMEYTRKEKEYVTFFEAKKKYFLSMNKSSSNTLSEDDSVKVDRMAIRDEGFTKYLASRVKDPLLFTLQEKCAKLVGEKDIDNELKRVAKNRQLAFTQYFRDLKIDNRVKIQPAKTNVPFDGFSYYELHYQGAMPDELTKAYQRMNELNSEDPRKKYKREHKKALP